MKNICSYINRSVAASIWSSKDLPISFSMTGDSWDVCSVDLPVKPLEAAMLLEEQGLSGGEEGRAA